MNELEALFSQIPSGESTDHQFLVELIKYVRPASSSDTAYARAKIQELIQLLHKHENFRSKLNQYIYRLLLAKNHIRLYTELGISSNPGFFSELIKRMNEKLLPPLIDKVELMDLLEDVFFKNDDYEWVSAVENELWTELFLIFDFHKDKNLYRIQSFNLPLHTSISILANRISALGLERELITRLPHIEQYQSYFLILPNKVFDFLQLLESTTDTDLLKDSYEKLQATITKCEEQLEEVRARQQVEGVSIRLVYLIERIKQNFERLKTLLSFTEVTARVTVIKRIARFFKVLVRAENRKHGVREHLSSNTDMLAFQIVEHTGNTGEHYITNTPKDYLKALGKSMGGGLIISFVTLIKFFISFMKFAPLTEAFWFSINYAIGFIAIYMPGFTLATKQPAMTASAIAGSLDSKKKEVNLDGAADMIVKMSRSQFVSFLGNLIVVLPLCYLLAAIYQYSTGHYLLSEAKSLSVLKANNAFTSMCILYGGVTGVFLFISGLISGYYDNKVDYNKIPQRIRQHKGLKKWLSEKKIDWLSNYIDNHLGGLAGNFFLGFFLGMTPAIGAITGLPLDVRHITLAGGSVAMALQSLNFAVTPEVLFGLIVGVGGIGFFNFAVSFGLTFFVAVKSRKLSFNQSGLLLSMVFARFLASPSEFVYPPIKKKLSLKKRNQDA